MSLFDDFDEDYTDVDSDSAGDDFDYNTDEGDEFDQFHDNDDDDPFADDDNEEGSVESSGSSVSGYLGQFTAGQRLLLVFLLLLDFLAIGGALMVVTGAI